MKNKKKQATINNTRADQKSQKVTEDNTHWGSPINYDKQQNTCRLLLQNTNGIKMKNNQQELHHIGLNSDAMQINILCLTETNVNWMARDTCFLTTKTLQKYWKHIKTGIPKSPNQQGNVPNGRQCNGLSLIHI